MTILYPKGYKGPILNTKANILDDVNRLSWYEWAIKDFPVSLPKYVKQSTKHWTELNLRAFLWSLAP